VKFRIASFVLVAAVIIVGKEYYRDATAADLRWILAPTAWLVSLFTGGHFIYEAGAGYADNALKFVIAPPCAGLNFAMAAFAAIMLASTITDWRTFAKRVGLALGLSYVATIVINTIRISIAVAMHRGTLVVGMADRAQAHRLEGIIIYLGGLLLLYALSKGKHIAVPIAAYLVITLGLPLANGAAGRGDFVMHAVWVLAACAVVLAIAFAISRLRRTPC
jgi:exosortase K